MKSGATTRLPLIALAALLPCAHAQIGQVPVAQAEVPQARLIVNSNAVLGDNATVTARDRTAEIKLERGGAIHVCTTTALHLSQTVSHSNTTAPLLLSLDHGAVEVHMPVAAEDTLLTPDLRFEVSAARPGSVLDLLLRVARNGDTCVENRIAPGSQIAPTLLLSEQLGSATYQLHPGQHVLFEHGSLQQVVDNEPSPCGCPPAPVISVADAGTPSTNPATDAAKPGATVAPAPAAAASASEPHPFPLAVSEGLAPPPTPAPSAPGEVHTQVTLPLTYDGANPKPLQPPPALPSSAPAASPTAASTGTAAVEATPPPHISQPLPANTSTAQAPPTPAPPPHDIFHAIGHLFRRIFRHT